jgi:RNA polymerase sigma-70 factor, ECF subfamily
MSSLTTSVTLLKRVQSADDHAAWKRFVDLYTPLLHCWTQRAGLTEDEGWDVVQEVLLVLVKELPKFRYDPDKGSFRSWLRVVTRNRCLEVFRGRQSADSLSRLRELEADSAELEDFWEREYRQLLFDRASQLLEGEVEPKTWQAYREYVMQNRPVDEVAAELGMSPNAVYLAKYRIIRRLREELHGLWE